MTTGTLATDNPTTQNEQVESKGRKPICGADLGNGRTCELDKGHDESVRHTVLDFTATEMKGHKVDPKDLPARVVTTQSKPDPEQDAISEKVAELYAEWVRNGSKEDEPNWFAFEVAAHKVRKMERKLTVAHQNHNPGLQFKRGGNVFLPDGKTRIIFAPLPKRTYKKKENANK